MFGLIWTILIGAVVGAIAKLAMRGKDGGGFFITAALGIGGALLAKFVGQMIGWYKDGQNAGLLASFLGAIVILALYRQFKKRDAKVA